MPLQAIPIKNLYYVFCYAWDRFPAGKSIEAGVVDHPDIWNLFASVLSRGVQGLLRRGLDRGYLGQEEDLKTVRGRIDVVGTVTRNLLKRGIVRCRYDELQHDIVQNRIIKATLRTLMRAPSVERTLVSDMHALVLKMVDVADIRLTSREFRLVQLNRNNGHYDLLLKICEMVHSNLLPDESRGRARFADILDNEAAMSKVFEQFIRNFYKAEQHWYSVARQSLSWRASSENPEHLAFVPGMETDTTLRSKRDNLIIDTKFYKEIFSKNQYGQPKVRRDHLFQISAYLRAFRSNEPGEKVSSILLYPTVHTAIDMKFQMLGDSIRIKTIDLNKDWREIRQALLELVQPTEAVPGSVH